MLVKILKILDCSISVHMLDDNPIMHLPSHQMNRNNTLLSRDSFRHYIIEQKCRVFGGFFYLVTSIIKHQ